jgi:effector-binding domain-containing protein
MEIKEKKFEEVTVVYIDCKGSYLKIPDYMQELGTWVMKKDLEMTGLVYGTYYNSPEEVAEEELLYEIGFSVNGNIVEEENIKSKTIPEHTVVAAMHKGPYTNVGPVIHAVAEYAISNGYNIVGPITEVYFNDPNVVDEEELLTEVQFPVMKP